MPGSSADGAGGSSADGAGSDATLRMAAMASKQIARANAVADELAAASLQPSPDEAAGSEDERTSAGWELVRQHSSEHACWIVIGSRVLDATGYLGHHPGGGAVIQRLAGRDATKAYRAAHHSRAADLKLHDFDVGAISDLPRLRRAARAAAEYGARLAAASKYLDD